MENIEQLLGRGLMGGVVFAAACAGFAGFFYLLYRLIKFMRPKKERREENRILSHRLYQVSGRGRIAYLILCLEETLQFYKQDLSDWEWILQQLWSITDSLENNWIDLWLDAVEKLLPSVVLSNSCAESPSAEINKVKTLYTQAGTAMIVINTIIETAYTIVCEWSPDTVAHDPSALCRIDKVEKTMNSFGVLLPSSQVIQPLLKQKDFSLGKPFDRLQLSHNVKLK